MNRLSASISGKEWKGRLFADAASDAAFMTRNASRLQKQAKQTNYSKHSHHFTSTALPARSSAQVCGTTCVYISKPGKHTGVNGDCGANGRSALIIDQAPHGFSAA